MSDVIGYRGASWFITSCLGLLLNATAAHALEAISDHEMSTISGQAFITIDTSSYSDATYGDFEFSKVNLGVDIEIMTNADTLKLGTFEREFGSEGTAPPWWMSPLTTMATVWWSIAITKTAASQ